MTKPKMVAILAGSAASMTKKPGIITKKTMMVGIMLRPKKLMIWKIIGFCSILYLVYRQSSAFKFLKVYAQFPVRRMPQYHTAMRTRMEADVQLF